MESALSAFLQSLATAYAFIDRLQLSATGLTLAAFVFVAAFAFAAREAASWFFKVDDLKREVRSLNGIVGNLEGEIRVLQSLIVQIGNQNKTFVSVATKKTTAATSVPVALFENQATGDSAPVLPGISSESDDDDEQHSLGSAGMKTGSFPITY